jgi:hypothetical protein
VRAQNAVAAEIHEDVAILFSDEPVVIEDEGHGRRHRKGFNR